MAKFSRVQVWSKMEELGLVPLFYRGDIDVAKKLVAAISSGGGKVIEFTNRGDRAFRVFEELVVWTEENHPDVILGAGSIPDPVTAGLYINLGANFIVGSVTNAEVAKLCNRRKVAYCPGCGTASEVSEAEELGCEIVKVFPGGQVGGPAFVKAVLGPCPWVSMMPTGGVDCTEESLKAWFEAGVTCVGIGSKLIRKDLVQAGDFDGIRENVKKTLEIIRRVRAKK